MQIFRKEQTAEEAEMEEEQQPKRTSPLKNKSSNIFTVKGGFVECFCFRWVFVSFLFFLFLVFIIYFLHSVGKVPKAEHEKVH